MVIRHVSGTVFHGGAFVGGYGFGLEVQNISGYGERTIFGLTYRGEWTHMRYEVTPRLLREFVYGAEQNGDMFFFDVGNRVTVTAEELKRVAKELEIW